jgi:hypothetical protein
MGLRGHSYHSRTEKFFKLVQALRVKPFLKESTPVIFTSWVPLGVNVDGGEMGRRRYSFANAHTAVYS